LISCPRNRLIACNREQATAFPVELNIPTIDDAELIWPAVTPSANPVCFSRKAVHMEHQTFRVLLLFIIVSLVRGHALAEEDCAICNNGHCTYSNSSQISCICPAGTIKTRPYEKDRYSNGADLCKFGLPENTSNCTWGYHCVRTGQTQNRPPAPASPSGGSTAYCSSKELGQKKQCIEITRVPGTQPDYYVKATCTGTYYAAIASYDIYDKCERSVVSVRPGFSELVSSPFHKPYVLDAIAGGKSSQLNCYTARHRGRGC
jgi:hypothetical protein